MFVQLSLAEHFSRLFSVAFCGKYFFFHQEQGFNQFHQMANENCAQHLYRTAYKVP